MLWLWDTSDLADDERSRRALSRRHRNPGGTFGASVVALAFVAGLVGGCKRDSGARGSAAKNEGAPEEPEIAALEARALDWLKPGTELPARAEVVALSDQVAVMSARLGTGLRALRLARAAGDLRARMWRVGHAEADAREAIELYAGVAKTALAESAVEEGCRSALNGALLGGELASSPAVTFRQVYIASKLFDAPSCEPAFSDALRTVEAFRPSKEDVAALDAEAARRRSEIVRPSAPAGSARVLATDESGVVLAPSSGFQTANVKVVAVEPYGSKDRARIVVTLSGPTSYRVGELAGPRLFLDLERTEAARSREITVGGLVQRVRLSGRKETGRAETTTRVVLDLSTQAYRRIFYLPEPFRVIVDVATHPPERATFAPGTPRQVARVALDAGHGGNDPGAIGPAGLREKDVTLDIAHLAAPVLSRELGILTLLTRDDDRFVPLDERAARANAFHADLFVSIHCNASENGAARGIMTFVLDTTREEIAAKIAARENATSLAASSQVASIASGLRLAEVGGRSSHLAELLQRSTLASLAGRFSDTSDQGVKTAGFFVLLGAEMPSVLFEASFISNPGEEKRLSTAEYRQKLADGIVNAIRAYREGR